MCNNLTHTHTHTHVGARARASAAYESRVCILIIVAGGELLARSSSITHSSSSSSSSSGILSFFSLSLSLAPSRGERDSFRSRRDAVQLFPQSLSSSIRTISAPLFFPRLPGRRNRRKDRDEEHRTADRPSAQRRNEAGSRGKGGEILRTHCRKWRHSVGGREEEGWNCWEGGRGEAGEEKARGGHVIARGACVNAQLESRRAIVIYR